MPRKILSVLLVLCGTWILSSTASAKSHRSSDDSAVKGDTQIHTFDEQMIEAGEIAEARAHVHSHRHCWRAVKNAMLAADVLQNRPTTRYAKQAGRELERRFGFRKLDVRDPFMAPIGSILVYGGHGAGHVEIRTADGFVSDFISDHPSHRPLIGVYVRI